MDETLSAEEVAAMNAEIDRILAGYQRTYAVHFFSDPSLPCPCRWCVKARETPWDSMT